MKPIKEITDWEVGCNGYYQYVATTDCILCGLSPQFKNGEVTIRTSKIVGYKDGMVETKNSIYKLVGPPYKDYAVGFTNQPPTLEYIFQKFITKDTNNG